MSDSDEDPITRILKRPRYGVDDTDQPSFDKIERPTTKKEISNYVGRFSGLLYELFRYDDLSKFSHEILPRISENMLGTYNNIADEYKEHFMMELTEDFLFGGNPNISYGEYLKDQRMFLVLMKSIPEYKSTQKLHKETKEWFKNLLNDLLNKLPSLGEKYRIRSEMLKEIILTIKNPYRFYRKTDSPGVEDVCMTETEKIAILLDYLVSTDTDNIIYEQLQDFIKEIGLGSLESVYWENNKQLTNGNKELEIKMIRSHIKYNIKQLGNKNLIAIMDGKEVNSTKKEEKKETKKETKKESKKEPVNREAIEAPKVPVARAQPQRSASVTETRQATPQRDAPALIADTNVRPPPPTHNAADKNIPAAIKRIEKQVEEVLKVFSSKVPLETIQFRLKNLMGHVKPTTAALRPAPQAFEQAYQDAQTASAHRHNAFEQAYQEAAHASAHRHNAFEQAYREGHLINRNAPSLETTRQMREFTILQQSMNELIALDPVKTGLIIDQAVQFNTFQIPENEDINEWVDGFVEVADTYANNPVLSMPHDQWANEFQADRLATANEWANEFQRDNMNRHSRTSIAYNAFKRSFKELVKLLPNSNDITITLLTGMINSANAAQSRQHESSIHGRVHTPEFAQFERNLNTYMHDLSNAPIAPIAITQPLPRLSRQLPQSRTTRHIPGVGVERRLYGGRKKKAVKTTK
jgi:hypothetical protein